MNVSASSAGTTPRYNFKSTLAALAALPVPVAAWAPSSVPGAPEVPQGAKALVSPQPCHPRSEAANAVQACPAMPPPAFAWDGVVRAAQVATRALSWDAPAVQACLQAHAGTPMEKPLAVAHARAAASAPAGLELSHLESPAEGTWPGCSLWMGEPMANGTSGEVRLGFLERPVGDWPAGLVAVKAMRTRPDVEALEWEADLPAAAPGGDTAADAPPPAPWPGSMLSPFAQAALCVPASNDRSLARSSNASPRTRARPSGASTSECHPERIVEEATCQRTYSPEKLPVMALLHDETTGMHYLIMRWMRGGSLHHARLNKTAPRQAAALGRLVLHSIAHDLNRLSPEGLSPEERARHPKGLAHDDVKPLNFFFDQDTVALGDWDVDREISAADGRFPRTGTPRYMAPERFPFGAPSVAADMWSLGVSVVELVSSSACPFAQARIEQPREGHEAHSSFSAFYAELFNGAPLREIKREAFERQFARLEATHPVIVSWLQPLLKADPMLCLFVLRHLLNPDPEQRLGPQQVLERRDEILSARYERLLGGLRQHLTKVQNDPHDLGNCRKLFLEHFLPQWAQRSA